MEKNVLNSQAQSKSGNHAKPALTPHELYNYHLLNPDVPITDDDIRNLKIDSGDVYKDHQLTDDEVISNTISDEESKDRDQHSEEDRTDGERPKASPYDILGG